MESGRRTRNGCFRAFGGGKTLCPGRHFATNEVLAFVFVFIVRYDMEPQKGRWTVPPVANTDMMSVVMQPDYDLLPYSLSRAGQVSAIANGTSHWRKQASYLRLLLKTTNDRVGDSFCRIPVESLYPHSPNILIGVSQLKRISSLLPPLLGSCLDQERTAQIHREVLIPTANQQDENLSGVSTSAPNSYHIFLMLYMTSRLALVSHLPVITPVPCPIVVLHMNRVSSFTLRLLPPRR